MSTTDIPCPFVYANGRQCKGKVTGIAVYHCKLFWEQDQDGGWQFTFQPGTHFHLSCSLKGNHAGYARPDADALKMWELPPEAVKIVDATGWQSPHVKLEEEVASRHD